MHYQWECKLLQPWWQIAWRSLKKLKKNYFIIQQISFGCMSKRMKTGYRRDFCTYIFTTALFTITKIEKQPKCPQMGAQIKKRWYINMHTHSLSGTSFSHEEENELSFLPFTTTWMKLEGYIKWYKPTEKDKYCMVWFIIHSILKICIKIKTHRSRE